MTGEITFNDISIVPEARSDAEDIYEYMGCDPEITRYTGWNPYHTLQSTIEKIERDLAAEDGTHSWVIKKDGEFVGTIGAYDYDSESSSIEIGYSIAREFWGRGYAGSAVKAVIEFLHNETDIKTIRAWSHRENIASIKVLRASGFVEKENNGEQIIYELEIKR